MLNEIKIYAASQIASGSCLYWHILIAAGEVNFFSNCKILDFENANRLKEESLLVKNSHGNLKYMSVKSYTAQASQLIMTYYSNHIIKLKISNSSELKSSSQIKTTEIDDSVTTRMKITGNTDSRRFQFKSSIVSKSINLLKIM